MILLTPRVLLVEDNSVLRNLYYRSLLSAGFAVMSAANEAQIRELLAEFRPSIVLLDLDLPTVDYTDLMSVITTPASGQPPVVIGVSGRDRDHIANIPVAHFLYKPVSLITMTQLVRHLAVTQSDEA
ncbi:MAG: response regulator transcription factor [Anaerolineae bacterium]|nr:response regulator transcription factor [Anaerolineae bacterium]